MQTTEVVLYHIKQDKVADFAKISPIVDSFAKKRKEKIVHFNHFHHYKK